MQQPTGYSSWHVDFVSDYKRTRFCDTASVGYIKKLKSISFSKPPLHLSQLLCVDIISKKNLKNPSHEIFFSFYTRTNWHVKREN